LRTLFRTKANNNQSKKNPAYDVIASKFYRVGERVYGFKRFSEKQKAPVFTEAFCRLGLPNPMYVN
jgi:hypothetical protein